MNNNQSSNNTNNFNQASNNGGANTPSLSGVNKAETDNRTLAAANSRKGDLGKRETPMSSLPSTRSGAQSVGNRGMTPRQAASREMNPLRKNQNSATIGNLGSKALGKINPLLGLAAKGANGLMNGRKSNAAGGADGSSEGSKDDATKSANDDQNVAEDGKKRDTEDDYNKKTGNITFAATKKVIIKLAIIVPIITISLFLLISLIGEIVEHKVDAYILGQLADEEKEKIVAEVVGSGDIVSPDAVSGADIPQDYHDRLEILGNNFTSGISCSGKSCESNPEFLYYLKVADLATRYRQKYGVELNIFLLIATDLYKYGTEEEGMEANIGGYDRDAVTDINQPSTLDWDTDFRSIDDYTYLDFDDSTYDLNILAKNMVKKKTTQVCSTGGSQTDEDVEDKFFEPGGEKRMPCSGSVSVISTYELDLDKYDEFLLEYIDKKFFSDSIRGNSLAEFMVNLAVAQLEDASANGGGKYKDFMGWGSNSGSAWCAAFVSWVIANTEYNGQKLNEIVPLKDGWVGAFAHWAYSNDKWYWNDNSSRFAGKNGGGTYTPKTGDLIFIDWECNWSGTMPTVQGDRLDHIGIVQRVEDNKIITIEGNRGGGRGKVKEDQYAINSCQVAGFVSWYE